MFFSIRMEDPPLVRLRLMIVTSGNKLRGHRSVKVVIYGMVVVRPLLGHDVHVYTECQRAGGIDNKLPFPCSPLSPKPNYEVKRPFDFLIGPAPTRCFLLVSVPIPAFFCFFFAPEPKALGRLPSTPQFFEHHTTRPCLTGTDAMRGQR